MMPTPEVIDVDALAAPVSDDRPAGCELRDDSEHARLFFEVKDSREQARASERQLAERAMLPKQESDALERESGPVESPDWKRVRDLSVNIIENHSKDLWVGAWLIESLLREHGFAGLRDGFRLVRKLVETYWDDIHPQPDEDGYATTVAQLTGLNGEDSDGALLAPIDQVPITATSETGTPLTSADYRDTLDLSKVSDPEKRNERIQRGVQTLEQFERAVRESGADFYTELLADVDAARTEFDALTSSLESRCGNDEEGYALAPPSSAIERQLNEIHSRIRNIAKPFLQTDDNEPEDEPGNGQLVQHDNKSQDMSVSAVDSAVQNREDAFQALLRVADFFRKTEPHSPVSYALEQAVRWGRMSLPDLMNELIDDQSVREDLFRRTGLGPEPASDDE